MSKYKNIDALIAEFHSKRIKIQQRLKEFSQVREEQYFYELCYCIMTPQSSAVNAGLAQKKLEENNFQFFNVNPEPLLYQPNYYVRFHKTKAKHLIEMKNNFSRIMEILQSDITAFEKRELLVQNVKGLSFKEATHFLRNIGKNGGLCILDRHIFRNLLYHGVIRTLPKTITKKHYLAIEKQFQKFAQEIGISVDELDLVLWSREAGEILK